MNSRSSAHGWDEGCRDGYASHVCNVSRATVQRREQHTHLVVTHGGTTVPVETSVVADAGAVVTGSLVLSITRGSVIFFLQQDVRSKGTYFDNCVNVK